MPKTARCAAPSISKAEQVERWWQALLRAILGVTTIVPHFVFIRGKVVGDKKVPLTLNTKLVSCLVIRGSIPYEKNRMSFDHLAVRAFVGKIRTEVEKLGTGTELEAALQKGGFRKCRLELIDTGKPKGGGASDNAPRLLIEKLLKPPSRSRKR